MYIKEIILFLEFVAHTPRFYVVRERGMRFNIRCYAVNSKIADYQSEIEKVKINQKKISKSNSS